MVIDQDSWEFWSDFVFCFQVHRWFWSGGSSFPGESWNCWRQISASVGFKSDVLLEWMSLGEVLSWRVVKKASSPVSQETLANIEETIQKATLPTWLPEASLFDFYVYNFSMKSLNIRMLFSVVDWLITFPRLIYILHPFLKEQCPNEVSIQIFYLYVVIGWDSIKYLDECN